MNRSLGKIVAQINRAAQEMNEDPMNDYAGFTPDCTPHLEEMAQEAGYASLNDLADEVAVRTSQRWAFFNLGF